MIAKFKGTTLLVKNAQKSIQFYTEKFGFTYLNSFNYKKHDYFSLAYSTPTGLGPSLFLKQLNDPNVKINNGNGPNNRGFGHLCVSVDNIVAAEKSMLANGVDFKKKLADGRQKDIAFALDPDGYWIELIENGINKQEGTSDFSNYRFNHSMIRVKDPAKSLAFYKETLGQKLLSTRKFDDAKFTLYFLGNESADFKEGSELSSSQAKREGIVELTHNWGTESDPNFEGYHNGISTDNGADPGFGSFTFGVNNLEEACKSADWDVKNSTTASITDPDGYMIYIEQS